MSGVVKGIKKAFKKVAKFIKKNWKVILIAAAVVVTAGFALGAFGAAGLAGGAGAAGGASAAAAGATAAGAGAGFAGGAAASFAGLSTYGSALAAGTYGAAGLGAVGAAGASVVGAGSVLAAGGGSAAAAGGAAAAGAAATTLPTVSVTAAAPVGTNSVLAPAAGAAGTAGTVAAGSGSAPGGSTPDAANENWLQRMGGKAKEGWKNMSAFEKIALLQSGVSLTSGLLAKQPDPFPIQPQYGGYKGDGSGPGMALQWNPSTGQMEYPQSNASGTAAGAEVADYQTSEREDAQPVRGGGAGEEAAQIAGGQQGNQGAGQGARDFNAPTEQESEQSEFINRGYATGNYSGVG